MTDTSITFQPATDEELDRIETLLTENDLPTADVRDGLGRFVAARSENTVVGAGGLELYESVGLLRSLVVDESARGQGLGSTLCDELEERAKAAGVDTLYLLTTTAEDFFRRRGYERIDRDAAPSEIRGTTEFRDLCPTSATCMVKEL
ncbi:GNAT family N-acetyltransferase [Natronomonas salina]|uniref:arsenic resistance N-acetyltransferase ArsN2 n=1 Tax=Natronomonas salina TaxID=1710540 RepID=UPI0015B66461|nr:arsenic resistance N-acetyltransferase ArsN2 [Natronomonas salina]QLD88096.1 GNAT family N-acetyltransferase [Natronomonas salina]